MRLLRYMLASLREPVEFTSLTLGMRLIDGTFL
jgi:hypothetical protein